ncbi:MAG: SlyX family protein [Sedimenticola sp.]|nr:SlyX family protein [Sedimenticola sp.]
MNDRLIDLEHRIAFQEDAIHQLTLTVSQQQNQINTLKLALQELHKQMRNLEPPDGSQGSHEIPPHY